MLKYKNKIENRIEKMLGDYTLCIAISSIGVGMGLAILIEGLLRKDVRTDVYVGMGLSTIVMNAGCISLIYESARKRSKLEQNLNN